MLGKLASAKRKDNGNGSSTPVPSRPTTPRPPVPMAVDSHPISHSNSNSNLNGNGSNGTSSTEFRTGMLTIRIFSGRNLHLPPGVGLPDAIKQALSHHAPGHAHKQSRGGNRDSLRRDRASWWLPYVVLEFDKNQILVDALGGTIDSPQWLYKAHFDVSRTSTISVSAYFRTAPCIPGTSTNDMGNDLLIARIDLIPSFDSPNTSDKWYTSSPPSTGEFHLQISFKPSHAQSHTIEDFELLKVIGKGSFGKVMQVRKKDTSRIYALKTIRKAHIASRPGEITHILAERTVLALVNNPFIVPLKFSFQNRDKLYLVMSFVNGGELFYHLQREGKFDEHRSRFYAAELLCALEHLHSFNVVYRDLKPENILLDFTGHIALCDFGLCKLNMSESEKTNTFCGTPEYIAPELLENQGYTKTVDWWTLGVLIYEMMTGLPPFYDENVNTMYQRILHDPLRFPTDPPLSREATSLISSLLIRNPAHRLGATPPFSSHHHSHYPGAPASGGAQAIKSHPFFSSINFPLLLAKQIPPPFKPSVSSVLDVANFDSEFTNEEVVDSVVEGQGDYLTQTVQERFIGFSYAGPGVGEGAGGSVG